MMKKIDTDGLLLCKMQAQTFESSISKCETSSEVFIRRFMYSRIAKEFDSLIFLEQNIGEKEIFIRLDEEYGKSNYGSKKYTANEMYWIGYIYRYFSYTNDMSSIRVYKLIKPRELRGLFLSYHTLDPAQAIERILEAKGIGTSEEDELKRQYRIFCRIRNQG